MRSKRPERKADADLYRARLDNILDHRHELFQLAERIDWGGFEEAFGHVYKLVGRPPKPTRLMVALSYLKHVHDLSDEEVVARWVENPYWQWFSGFEYFQHEAPIDPSLWSRWRKRIGPEGLEKLLAETVLLGVETGVVKPSSLKRVSVDTSVQPKAIAHPTDSRLYHKALEVLVRRAKRAGIPLRQAHTRLAKQAAVRAGRYAHARQYQRMKRELRRLRTYLGRVYRDVGRKIAGDDGLQAHFGRLLGLIERLLSQQPKDKNKLYSLHAPEVACIAKGKARTPYEFGCKVGIAATNREDFVVAAKAFAGNPYDGHTLAATLEQAEAMSGVTARRVYVHRGYRGHDVADKDRVYIAGRKRGVTPTIRRELRRRSAIEATIGHMKTDGRIDRNHLLGTEGDATNAILAAAGYNLRQTLAAAPPFCPRAALTHRANEYCIATANQLKSDPDQLFQSGTTNSAPVRPVLPATWRLRTTCRAERCSVARARRSPRSRRPEAAFVCPPDRRRDAITNTRMKPLSTLWSAIGKVMVSYEGQRVRASTGLNHE